MRRVEDKSLAVITRRLLRKGSVTVTARRRKDAARRLWPVAFGDPCPGPPLRHWGRQVGTKQRSLRSKKATYIGATARSVGGRPRWCVMAHRRSVPVDEEALGRHLGRDRDAESVVVACTCRPGRPDRTKRRAASRPNKPLRGSLLPA
jgi:hypothetical protein